MFKASLPGFVSSIGQKQQQQQTSNMSTTSTSSSKRKNKDNDGVDDLTDKLKEQLDLKGDSVDVPGASEESRRVAEWIRKAEKILVLSGAGVSVSAGIPDFRTPGTGLYDNLQEYNLPYPEAVFDVAFYKQNPKPFLRLAQEIWPGMTHSPTLTHAFLKVLSDKQKLLRNYSQNIDGLEHLAGVPVDEVVECHGHFREASCTECGKPFDGEECKRIMLEEKMTPVCSCRPAFVAGPTKKQCGGYIKPTIVFFGEGLPDRFHHLLQHDKYKADLLLVMGTSLQVAPVSYIPEMVDCKRVLINREEVGDFDLENGNDCFLGGDCDDSVLMLAKLLGWEDELRARHQKVQIKQGTNQ